jgi:pilus assembly protein Flp/PilA
MGGRAMRRFFSIFKDQRGATAVEYGIILGFVFMALIVGVSSVGTANTDLWSNISQQVAGS